MALIEKCRVAAVVTAAGSGTRMGDGPRKQFRLLGGRPLVEHSLETLAGHPEVDGLVLVLPADDPEAWTPPGGPGCFADTPLAVVAGGASRQASVLRGLDTAAAWSPQLVLVHDGIRPLVSPELLERVIRGARKWGAVSPVLEVSETVKAVDGEGRFCRTLDRHTLRLVQTPEGFVFPMILDAARQALAAGFEATDTASLVRLAGREVRGVDGERSNIKITGPQDLALAQRLIAGGGEAAACRVGTGYDAHRLVPGRRLILGGVEIPHTHGLEGHSDADVLLHALADALLGAAALGDLGRHFPESDPGLAGVSSIDLLHRTMTLIGAAGWEPVNADATVVAQQPRLSPFVRRMRATIAEALGIRSGAVSVKATSTEGMGFEGRGEGISATVVVLLRPMGERNR
jgi:2-C-methyl-D-erythritol 2,4-cyclodiphosphate synthase/2-C-methyl-D-erythritol 4-phosphate cytidylyltransferase